MQIITLKEHEVAKGSTRESGNAEVMHAAMASASLYLHSAMILITSITTLSCVITLSSGPLPHSTCRVDSKQKVCVLNETKKY